MEFEQSLCLTPSQQIANDSWQVEIFDVCIASQREKLAEYMKLGRVSHVHDTLDCQLTDFLRSANPRSKSSDCELKSAFLRDHRIESLTNYGVWVFYPWTGRLVHTLPQSYFQSLRTDRNRHKISSQEQARLQAATIGIVGLSAGMAVATSMVLEGVGGRFRIADFDTLGLSNLNRIQASIADLGTAKTVIAARSMLEMNPFLDIQVYPHGITEENVCEFFGESDELDILVEECDSLWMKIRLREEARIRRIPVVMDTSDRGLLDVERFDLENSRPIFHNLIGDATSESLKELSAKERIGFVLKILGAEQISPSASASLLEIGQSISTWPQLGSSVIAGGAVVTDVVRRILLNTFTQSGRFSVDVESMVSDGAGRFNQIPECEKQEECATGETLPARPIMQDACTLTEQEFRWLISLASLAPSGGNSQPWRFSHDDGSIVGSLATERRSPILDYKFNASLLALGAAAENIMLAAPELGLVPSLDKLDRELPTEPVFRIRFVRNAHATRDVELFSQIGVRCTNRRLSSRKTMQSSHIQTLRDEAGRANATLEILTESKELDAIAQVVGYGDRLRFLSEPLHREMMSELRWTTKEVSSKRDGIDVATLEISQANVEVLKLLSSWPAMKRLREIGGGTGLETPSHDAISSASAFALLRSRSNGPCSCFEGGRALQRVWLRAALLGLSIQPMSVLVYLFDRIENGDAVGLDEDTQTGLRTLYCRYRELFPKNSNSTDLLLFRIAYADPPSVRSKRLRFDDIVV